MESIEPSSVPKYFTNNFISLLTDQYIPGILVIKLTPSPGQMSDDSETFKIICFEILNTNVANFV